MFLFALTTPIAAIIATSVLHSMNEFYVSVAIGVSAGTFLFISVGDLLPTVYEEHRGGFKNLLCLGLGILMMVVTKDVL